MISVATGLFAHLRPFVLWPRLYADDDVWGFRWLWFGFGRVHGNDAPAQSEQDNVMNTQVCELCEAPTPESLGSWVEFLGLLCFVCDECEEKEESARAQSEQEKTELGS